MIAVHAGAGYHSPAKEVEYSKVLSAACREAGAVLARGGSAADAVEAAIKLLEDCPACNAGLGSNLTFRGMVECDASLMAGDGAFGAVAAAPGLDNPIAAAAALAADGRAPLSHGRVRPMVLAGDRAREWALGRGLAAAATSVAAAAMHVTPDARRRWECYRAMLRGGGGGGGGGATSSVGGAGSKRRRMEGRPDAESGDGGDAGQELERRGQQAQDGGQVASAEAEGAAAEEGWALDTVGCVVVDARGRVAAGVSSGGIALKTEGRVGEAAAFGAGCWAQDAIGSGGQPGVAVSVSGVGEHIMRHLLARECALRLAAAGAAADAACGAAAGEGGTQQRDGQQADDAGQVAADLLRRTMLRGPPPRDCGLLAVTAALEGPPLAAARTPAAERRSEGGGEQGGEQGGGQLACIGGAVLRAELVVAHCSRSMAVAHCALDGGGGVSRPAVAFLRRAGSDGDVRVLLHGSSWQLPQS